MKNNYFKKKIWAVTLAFAILAGLTACGKSSEQTEDGQDTIVQAEEEQSIEEDTTVSVSEPVAEETGADTETEIPENTTEGTESNVLIAYFSRVGNMDFNANVDAVVSASVNMDGGNVAGNAELLAYMVQETAGGDLFFIETVEKYPAEYRETTNQAKTEQNNGTRPELSSHVENMDAYDTVILIYPNWWGTLPQPVVTFLEEYDFSGKTILPLCTHEGSGLGGSERDIQSICPNVQLLDGLSVRGSNAGSAQAEVEEWINGSGILE